VTEWRYIPGGSANTRMSLDNENDEERRKKNVDGKKRTELGDEEQEHEDRGSEGDNAAGERSAVEIFVDFGVRVEVAELAHYAVHA